MKLGILLIALGLLAAVAAIAEAFVRRNRPRRRLADSRPEMPPARHNLGAGYDREWRPDPIPDVTHTPKMTRKSDR